MVVYIYQCYCPNLSILSFPWPHPVSACLFLCLRLYSCPENQYRFSRFHIYALTHDIVFSLTDSFHFLQQTLSPSTSKWWFFRGLRSESDPGIQDHPSLAAQPLFYGLEAQGEPGPSMRDLKVSLPFRLLHTLSRTHPSKPPLVLLFSKRN